MSSQLHNTLQKITPLDAHAMNAAQELQSRFIKPAGSLGELERISIQLAGITGQVKNNLAKKVICLFGSDHGIFDEGVCSSPQDFTRKLMLAYAERQNAGINILARQANSELKIFDLGVKNLQPHKNIITRKFLPDGTKNFLHGRAMPREIAEEVITFGIDTVRELKAQGFQLIGTGEVGMANTTPACACIPVMLHSWDEAQDFPTRLFRENRP